MTRLLGTALAILTLTASGAAGQARTVRHTSTMLGGERIFSVLLPAGYNDSDRRYPVVYLFHGVAVAISQVLSNQKHNLFTAKLHTCPSQTLLQFLSL